MHFFLNEQIVEGDYVHVVCDSWKQMGVDFLPLCQAGEHSHFEGDSLWER